MISSAQNPGSSTQGAREPRIQTALFDGHEELRIPATWPGLKGFAGLLVALPFWILAASFKFGAKTFYSGWQGLVVVFAIVTVLFIAYAILQIVWWLGGSERLAAIDGDLLVRHTVLGVPISTRAYRGHDIRFLDAVDRPEAGWLDEPLLPFMSSGRCGALKFFYREATVYLGHDLGLDDGRQAASWLRQRLPATASD